jgi:hypothetical protein
MPRPTATITLEQYASAVALLDDGETLADALAFAAIPRDAWPGARKGWDARLVADLRDGGDLAEELERAKCAALLARRATVPPFHTDLAAYLTLDRHLAAAPSPERLLAKAGLSPCDPQRLWALWAPRLRNASVAADAVRLLSLPLGPLPSRPALPA